MAFNNVQKEDMYEVFLIIFTVLFESLYTVLDFPLPSTKVNLEYLFMIFINERHSLSYTCLSLFQDGTWTMLSALQIQNTVTTGSEEMQRRSAQVKVAMDLNSLSLPSPASSLLVAYPKPVLLFFGLCDNSLGYKILFSASFWLLHQLLIIILFILCRCCYTSHWYYYINYFKHAFFFSKLEQ